MTTPSAKGAAFCLDIGSSLASCSMGYCVETFYWYIRRAGYCLVQRERDHAIAA